MREALDRAAGLKRFFGLADPAEQAADWQPVSLLYTASAVGPLDEIIEAIRKGKGGCEPAVAASIFFLGYAARLLSPPLACIAIANCLPQMPADRLLWRRPQVPAAHGRQPAGEMIRLAMTAGNGWTGSRERLIARLIGCSFEDHLQPLVGAVRSRVRIAPPILRDSAASALINGMLLLATEHLGPDWKDLARHALAQPCLRGSGSLPITGPLFVRHSCCLIYRVPPGARCGDCPLDFRPDGSRRT